VVLLLFIHKSSCTEREKKTRKQENIFPFILLIKTRFRVFNVLRVVQPSAVIVTLNLITKPDATTNGDIYIWPKSAICPKRKMSAFDQPILMRKLR
jgi:hypothetical protein